MFLFMTVISSPKKIYITVYKCLYNCVQMFILTDVVFADKLFSKKIISKEERELIKQNAVTRSFEKNERRRI